MPPYIITIEEIDKMMDVAYEGIKKLKKSLSPFCADLKVINIAYFLITEYKRLNQDKELKVRVLLHLHLPNIETKLIARNIVKNLPPKYQ
jgi:hypothetical protein